MAIRPLPYLSHPVSDPSTSKGKSIYWILVYSPVEQNYETLAYPSHGCKTNVFSKTSMIILFNMGTRALQKGNGRFEGDVNAIF